MNSSTISAMFTPTDSKKLLFVQEKSGVSINRNLQINRANYSHFLMLNFRLLKMKKAILKYSRTTIKSRYHLISCTKVQAVDYLDFLIFESLALRNDHPVFTVPFSPSAISMATTFFHCSHKGWIYYKQTTLIVIRNFMILLTI